MDADRVRRHFEGEAEEYDTIIVRLIPHYQLMLDILVSLLPCHTGQPLNIIDLGCGTGTLTQTIQKACPTARFTCVDVATNMLALAAAKNGPQVSYIEADFNTFDFPEQYDVIVSSLALHHLITDAEKQHFYGKIYRALQPGGVFANIDVMLGADSVLQAIYMQQWQAFMEQHVSLEEIEEKWLPNYYAEDHPISLRQHMDMLRRAGFPAVDVAYKYYNYAVYCARK